MIDQVRFKDFKCLQDLTLNFSKGVNVISGSSDSGKTTAIKGLLWSLMNTPQGKSPVRHGEKACQVITRIDGHEIERGILERNYYKYDGERLTAFRNTVPDVIADVVRMTDINVQNRRDLPFMICEKAGDAANRFSTMLDLSEIETSLTNISAEVKSLSNRTEEQEAREKELKLQSDALLWVDGAMAELELIEAMEKEIDEASILLGKYRHALEDFMGRYNEYLRLKPVKEAISEFNQLQEMFSSIGKEKERLSMKSSCVSSYLSAEQSVCLLKSAPDALMDWAVLSELYEERKELSNKVLSLQGINKAYTMGEQEVKALEPANAAILELLTVGEGYTELSNTQRKLSEMRNAERSYNTAYMTAQTAKEAHIAAETAFTELMPDICPLCGLSKSECKERGGE